MQTERIGAKEKYDGRFEGGGQRIFILIPRYNVG